MKDGGVGGAQKKVWVKRGEDPHLGSLVTELHFKPRKKGSTATTKSTTGPIWKEDGNATTDAFRPKALLRINCLMSTHKVLSTPSSAFL
jgi:hypothetical protein